MTRPLHIFLIAGEPSGDALGGALMASLRQHFQDRGLRFSGVGGPAMLAGGLEPLFPMADIAVMGVSAVLARLPLLLARIAAAARAVAAQGPAMLVTIDSPDFTLRVARRVRRAAPQVPIVHMVCPSVWAWRPGRARRMRPHVDHILALLPFEPEALARLDGPPATYIGHPLIERLADLRPGIQEQARRDDIAQPEILVLPGSRRSELERMLPVFRDTVALLAAARPQCEFVLPAVEHLRRDIAGAVERWPQRVYVVAGEQPKWTAFRRARAALAASGTVTLELALSGVPMVAGYRVSGLEAAIARHVLRVESVILPNLILGEPAVPEFLQDACSAQALAASLLPLIDSGEPRDAQLARFARLDRIMGVGGERPSRRAAEVIAGLLSARENIATNSRA